MTGMYIEIVFLLFLIRTETPSVLDRKIEATFSPQSPNLPFSGLYNNFESVRTGTGSYICTSPNHESSVLPPAMAFCIYFEDNARNIVSHHSPLSTRNLLLSVARPDS